MILAIVQARLSSRRLPGKVLKPILGQPMIVRQLERVGRSVTVGKVVVATSTDASDDALLEACKEQQPATCFRGSLNDVLDRVYKCARRFDAQHIVRITGDCPLIDPAVIDDVVSLHLDGRYDYTSNVLERTYPDGLDVEVLSKKALRRVWREAHRPDQREHVTRLVREHPECFRVGSHRGRSKTFGKRWTVDEPADLEFVRVVYESLYPANPCFSWRDVLELLKRRPEIEQINAACGDPVLKRDPLRIAS